MRYRPISRVLPDKLAFATLEIYLIEIAERNTTPKIRAWYREADRNKAEQMLGLLEEKIARDSLYEFKELLHTFSNWRKKILNYFDYRITNGFVEGKNNRIKTIERMAYGYRNMDNFQIEDISS